MFKTIRDFDVANKKVLVRCDFNVPQDERGNITDDFRITQTIPTIQYLIEHKAKVILMTHWGEPGGKIVDDLKLDPIAKRLSQYLGSEVVKANDCVGGEVETQVNNLEAGEVMLLENVRFHKEETEGSMDFAKQLSLLGDIYVNDAFGVCHRNHASVTGVPKFLPHCAGLLLEKEIVALDKILQNPAKPMVAIVGGAKVETKSKFIDNISNVADMVIIGGLLAQETKDKNIQFAHPEKIIVPVGDLKALDINAESIALFREKILSAKSVLWNGAFGKFEDETYAKGTRAIAEAIINSGAFSVVGGGETVEFLTKEGILQEFSHVSTGGGAMLNYLAGDKLPGLEALN